jgi:hypothetical protein
MAASPPSTPGINVRDTALSLIVSAALPFITYQVLTSRGIATVSALIVSGFYPAAWNAIGIVRARRVDIIGGIVLVGIAVSIVAALIGGNPKVLLIRESFVTGALGIVALASLLAPRPLMFYIGRQTTAGTDSARLASFNASWELAGFRHVFRVLTVVWGVGWAGEFALRVVLVSLLTIPQVLAISPIIFNFITIGLFVWTFAYVRRARERYARLAEAPILSEPQQPAFIPPATTPPATTPPQDPAPAPPRRSIASRRLRERPPRR